MAAPFTGLTGRKLTTEYLELSQSVYAGGLEQPQHSHEPAYFTVVLHGRYIERVGAHPRLVRRSAILYHSSGEEHSVQFLAPETCVFRLQSRSAFLAAAHLAHADFHRATTRLQPLVRAIHDCYAEGDALAPLAIDALACELVIAASARRACGADQRRIASHARDILEAHFADPPQLPLLAEHAGCHPITLARAFRRTFGCSIGQYVRRRRLEEAGRMLRDTDEAIDIIAVSTGFADQAHLTRELRQRTGVTPARYRDRTA